MVFQDSTKPCRGDFHLAVYKDGKIIDRIDDHNLVVDAGRIRLAELAAGKSGSCITRIGVGSGSAQEAATDTELAEQQLFPLASASVDGRDARFDFLIDSSDILD